MKQNLVKIILGLTTFAMLAGCSVKRTGTYLKEKNTLNAYNIEYDGSASLRNTGGLTILGSSGNTGPIRSKEEKLPVSVYTAEPTPEPIPPEGL